MSGQHWGTRLGVILAVAGSAVGLGNFLRFPGQAAQHGGGAFLIPYFCALIFLGIPIGWAEWTMARYGGRKGLHSGPAIMGVAGKGSWARYLGILSVLIPLGVSFYYTYIEAWCLQYTWYYLTGGIGLNAGNVADHSKIAGEFFGKVSGANENGLIYGGSYETLVFWLITFAINIWLVFRGLSGGIEKFCSLAMPAMAVCAIIVLIRVLTLGTPDPAKPDQSVLTGLGFMWNPDFSKLLDAETWLAAAGQIFFSLSVGFGVILNYASYMKKNDDVALSGLTAAATNEFFEVGFGGMITLTASVVFLGVSATLDASGSSFSLGFKTLPVVFAQMGTAGNFIGMLWFFMLFLAAITSSISMYQPSLAFFEESLGISRKRGTVFLTTICLVGSFLVMYYSKDLEFLDTIDSWVGTFLIFVLAGIQIFCFSWIFGLERGWNEMHLGAKIKIPSIFKFVLKWVAPVYLLVVFTAFCIDIYYFGNWIKSLVTSGQTESWLPFRLSENLGTWIGNVYDSPTRQGAVLLIAVVAAILVGCVFIGEKRWRRDNIDINDDQPLID